MTRFILLILMGLITSCVAIKPVAAPESPAIVEQTAPLTVFPITPTIKPYSRKPVIDSVDNNFVVSDEFVENSLKYKQYHDKVLDWKNQNEIE